MAKDVEKIIESYCELSQQLAEEYRQRRALEWRMHVALWTVLAAFVYLCLDKKLSVETWQLVSLSAFVVLLHVAWSVKIVLGQIREQNLSAYYRACAVALLREAHGGLPSPPKEEEGSYMPKWLARCFDHYFWWLFVQVGTTLFICGIAFALLKKEPNQAPEPTPMSVTTPAAQEPRRP